MAVQTPPPAESTLDVNPDADLERQLDQLIPRSSASFRRFVISFLVVAAALSITVLNVEGWLYPRPTERASWSSGGWLWPDAERGLVGAVVKLPNLSGRSVRVTEVNLDAPGVELIAAEVWLEPQEPATEPHRESSDGRAMSTDEQTMEMGPSELGPPLDAAALPAVVPPDRWAQIVVWFEPTDCEAGGLAPWGVVDVTVDFGDGAFPPFSRTIRLDEDPIFEVWDQSATALVDGGSLNPTGELTFIDGPTALSVACEALR